MAARKRSSPEESPKNVVAAARGGRGRASGSRARAIWENFKSLAAALLIFLMIRTFLIEAYRIPSGSMIPTLLIGDWLFVNKLVYGPHIPFTHRALPGYAQPKRGEVVVFESPPQLDEALLGRDPTPTLVKRLMGVSGDTLYMRDDVLYVNGIAEPQGPEMDPNPRGDPSSVDRAFEWQNAFALKTSRFGPAPDHPAIGNWGPIVVPEGQYFMLGDNRYNSKDGRYWGFVPRANFRGRPLFVYYSYVPSASSDRALSFLTDIRWRRIGHLIR